jgi:hypothetical protein
MRSFHVRDVSNYFSCLDKLKIIYVDIFSYWQYMPVISTYVLSKTANEVDGSFRYSAWKSDVTIMST